LLFCNFAGKIAKFITILEMIGKGLAGLQKIEGEYPSTKETNVDTLIVQLSMANVNTVQIFQQY